MQLFSDALRKLGARGHGAAPQAVAAPFRRDHLPRLTDFDGRRIETCAVVDLTRRRLAHAGRTRFLEATHGLCRESLCRPGLHPGAAGGDVEAPL